MSFKVQITVGEDHFCIEVTADCSVGDVLRKASKYSRAKGGTLWYSDIRLNDDHLFADYFEPEIVYQVKVGGNFQDGTLLNSNEAKLRPLGVDLKAPKLLMEMEELRWSMDDFLQKVGDSAPTLLLVRGKNGTVCGGVAGVPWPKRRDGVVADPAMGSFIFSLGATPTRFDLVRPDVALYCTKWSFGFGHESRDLYVLNHGDGCGSLGDGDYVGPRGYGQLVGATAGACYQRYERWELWRL
jgi:hypothetical protein